jgi:hypothetical protein
LIGLADVLLFLLFYQREISSEVKTIYRNAAVNPRLWGANKSALLSRHVYIIFDPPHPGEIVREDCLEALDLSDSWRSTAARYLPPAPTPLDGTRP